MVTSFDIDFEARVANGVAWLDEVFPDWVESMPLDLDRLEMARGFVDSDNPHSRGCVLAFLDAEQNDSGLGCDESLVDTWDVDATTDGFALNAGSDEAWGALTNEWRRVITARRAETS